MRKISKNTKEAFIAFYIDIFQLLNLPEEARVKDRLREFLIHSVIMHNEGWILNSSSSVHEIAKRMKFINRDEVYNYRKKLKAKGLLKQTHNDLLLPNSLMLKSIPKKVTFTFTVVNDFE